MYYLLINTLDIYNKDIINTYLVLEFLKKLIFIFEKSMPEV